MATNKKSFILYCDIIHTVQTLSDDEAGKLFKHVLEYVNDLNPKTDDRLLQIAFEPIKQSLKRDLEKWVETAPNRIEKAKNAGIASAKARQLNSTKSNSLVENELNQLNPTNSTVSVSVSVSDSVIVSDSEEKKKVNKFTPPTILEVVEYFISNGYTKVSAEKAFQYYHVANWKDSKGNQVKNWKQKMQGVWFKDENKEQAKKERPMVY